MKKLLIGKIAHFLYLLFVEFPIIIVFVATMTGFTTIIANYERAKIYELARQRDKAIVKGIIQEGDEQWVKQDEELNTDHQNVSDSSIY